MNLRRIMSLISCLVLTVGAITGRTVKGVVLEDSNGDPVIGATVMCKGTKVATATDLEGAFTLTIPDNAKALTVSYIGMVTQDVPVADNVTVRMKSSDTALDEVIVVAFGEQKKSSFTGSAGVLNSDDMKSRTLNDPVSALSGKIPGVIMSNASGDPSSTATIQIRGTGSINADNDPLFVVDGNPVGTSYSAYVNPEDIESITVLKDAASNALYGARAANGVVMITTKKGKNGKARINFNAKVGTVSRAVQEYDKVTDPRAYYELGYTALSNYYQRDLGMSAQNAHVSANANLGLDANQGGLGYIGYSVPQGQYLIGYDGKMNPAATPGYVTTVGGQDYLILADDWVEESFRTGLRQEYNVNVSGGVNHINYYATAGYLNNQGILKGSDYERYSFRFKTDLELRDWLTLNVNTSYVRTEHDGVPTGSGSIFNYVNKYANIYPMYIRDGNGNIMTDDHGIMFDYGDAAVVGMYRPFMNGNNYVQENQLNTRHKTSSDFSLSGNLKIQIPWVKGLSISLNNYVRQNNAKQKWAYQPYYGLSKATSPNGYVIQRTDETFARNFQQLINYSNTFGNHNVSALLGHEYFRDSFERLQGGKKNMFSFEGNQFLNGAVTTIDSDCVGYETMYNTEGYFVRGMYDYAGKYFAQASYRRDASSYFHPDYRWGNFYSLGGAWIISKESFFPQTPAVNELKVKASFGQQGNDRLGDDFLYTTKYTIQNVNDEVGLNMYTTRGAKDITWETNSNFNTGVEFGFFSNRISGEVEYFYRMTTDMLCKIRLPLDAGYAYQWGNVGDMRNQGVEFNLNFDIIQSRDFSWSLGINGTHYRNRILKLNDDNKGVNLDGHDGYTNGNYFLGEGLSIHSWRMRRYAGVNDNGEALYYVRNNETGELTTTNNLTNGTFFYCGNADPDLYGGISTNLSWKGIDLGVQMAYTIGGKVLDSGYMALMKNPSAGATAGAYHKDILDAWSETNTESGIPRFQYAVLTSDQNANAVSDRFLTDASCLSLQNINLGYTFPKSVLGKSGIQRLRVYASGDNICYLSKRKGFDPRNTFDGTLDTNNYSLTRNFTFGVEIGF